MKKIIVFIFAFISLLSLSSCNKNNGGNTSESDNTPSGETLKEEKQMLELVNSYVVDGTNGFDYLLEQKLNGSVVNSHNIIVRLDNSSDVIGSRVESKKTLNEDLTQGQYTEVNATTYYKNNKIATFEDNLWKWKNCQFREFASVNISSFSFDANNLKELKLTSAGKFSVLTFKIDDADASTFLGINGNVKNLSFEIKANDQKNQLVSFNINYSQELTSTSFSFVPYYGSVNIELPL